MRTLVIPSILGHGFSVPLNEPGWTDSSIARAFVELMARLGYECYGIQPGDAGAFIAAEMGRFDTAHVIGVHVNSLVTYPSGAPTDKVSISHLKY